MRICECDVESSLYNDIGDLKCMYCQGIVVKERADKFRRYNELKNIEWLPRNAVFQLSRNCRYARHEKSTSYMRKILVMEKEIYKKWKLKPYAEDEKYYYFH